MRGHGNSALYSLLTAYATSRKVNHLEPATTREFVAIALLAGFIGTSAKPIEELVYIHLHDAVKKHGTLQTTTPFDHQTPIIERRWFA